MSLPRRLPRKLPRACALLAALFASALLAGCASGPVAQLDRNSIAPLVYEGQITTFEDAQALVQDEDLLAVSDEMRAFVAEGEGPLVGRYALAALPAAEAALAHRRGDHERVLKIMMPARRNLWQMGGSHAQRDLFFQILADSAMKLGRKDALSLMFDDLRTAAPVSSCSPFGLPS